MTEPRDDHVGAESIEAGLREVFASGARAQQPDESIIDVVARQTGSRPGVLLRDGLDDSGPVLRLPSAKDAEAASDARYQVLGEIARGGVGVVLKTRDKDLGRDVALKVLRREFAHNADVLERFVEEAQIGGQLQHPGIVPVYGLGLQPDGRPFFAMKLVKGRTLSALLEQRKDPAERRRYFLGIFEQVCQTIAYAHARGVIHRDLKPSNIMVGGFGEVQVVDWGFAKVLGTAPKERVRPEQTIVATVRSAEGSEHSVAGSVLGTPAYMPPEQALGQLEILDERADVFCLGGILCEILTGRPPYVGDQADLFTMAASGLVENAYARLDGCGAEPQLVAFAKNCLAASRDDRLRDAGVVAKAISEQLAATEELARQVELKAAEARAQEQEEQARLAKQELAAKQAETRAAEEERAAAEERARQRDEQRRAEWERKARVRTIAIAAALLVAVLAGGGGYLMFAADAEARRQKSVAEMNAALEEASEYEGKGKWANAIAAAKRAAEAARDPESAARVAATLAALETGEKKAGAQAAQEDKDRRFLAKLEELAYLGVDEWDHKKAEGAYVAAFKEYGCDVEGGSVEEAVAALRATTEPVRLAAALDRWATNRMDFARERGLRLVRIAQGLDPDPERNRLREAVVAADRDVLLRVADTIDAATTDVMTLSLLANALIHIDEITALRRLMHRAHRAHPDDAWANLWLGYAYSVGLSPDASRAMPYYTAAIALRPQSAQAKLRLAVSVARYARFDEALALCDQVLAKQPNSVAAYSMRCQVLGMSLRFDEAEQAGRKALELDPTSRQALGSLMAVTRHRGDFDTFMELAGRMLENAGDKVQAQVRADKAWVHYLRDEVDAAVDEGRRSLALRPTEQGYDILGEALRVRGDVDEAERVLREGERRFPDASGVQIRLGLLYMHGARYEEARRCFVKVYRVNRPMGAAMLANYHHARHEIAESTRYSREAIRLFPLDSSAWNLLALNAWEDGDARAAFAYLEQAKKRSPTDAVVADSNAAWMLEELGRYEEAYALLEPYLKENCYFIAVYDVAGRALLHMGRAKEARRVFGWGLAMLERRPPAARNSFGPDVLPEDARDADRVLAVAGREDDAEPADAAEALALATRCYYRSQHARAAALYERAFTLDRALAEDPHDRDNAACAGVQAGGEWIPKARAWLRGSLAAWEKKVEKGEGNDRILVRWVAQWWRRTPALAPVRDTVALAGLSDAERDGWLAFWGDVDALVESTREEK